jgi:hypothetical protein
MTKVNSFRSNGTGARPSRSALLIALTLSSSLFGQSGGAPLPKETAGLDNIVPALIAVFNHADVLALGEDHFRRLDSDLRIALVRHPDFPNRAQFIMVEFATDLHQTTVDRYVGGAEVSAEELRQAWATTASGQWDSPVYADFFAAVREVNAKLPPAKRIRVLAGDPGKGVKIARDDWAVSTLRQQVLEKGEKALVIYGAGHFFRTRAGQYALPPSIGGISKSLDADYPGRTFVVVTLGGDDPRYENFERALQTSLRPVLVSLQRPPFRGFAAEDFLGPKVFQQLPGGEIEYIFQGSGVPLGDTADAALYSGTDEDANPLVMMPER